jgi:hypothetical protein
MRAALAAALLAAACAGEGDAPVGLRATVIRPVTDSTRDTVRFEAVAAAYRCRDGRGWLVQGSRGGNGVLVWLRPGRAGIAGEYPPLPRADTTGRRGAIAAVRFMAGDGARGTTLDSGRVTAVETAGGGLEVTADGSGLVVPGGVRVAIAAAFAGVPAATDSTTCVVQP